MVKTTESLWGKLKEKLSMYLVDKESCKAQKLYVHIGMPKTGSSAIQAFLALNESYLLKHGFCYPNHTGFKQAFQTSAGNVTDMRKWVENGNQQAFKFLLNQSTANHVILSSEILFIALKKYPKRFAELLAGAGKPFKIICYVREFGDLIESVVNQHIKNHFLVNYKKIDELVQNSDYFNCLLEALKYFKNNEIVVKRYGEEYFYNGSIYEDFLQVLGLELDDSVIFPEKVVNPSLNRAALELRILLNKSFFGQDNVDVMYHFNGVLAKFSVENKQGSMPLLTPELRSGLKKKYADKEQQFISHFFSDLNKYDDLFKHKKRDQNEKYAGLSIEALSKLFSYIQHNEPELYKYIINFANAKLKNHHDKALILKAAQAIQTH